MNFNNEIVKKLIEGVIAQAKEEFSASIFVSGELTINKNIVVFSCNKPTTIIGIVEFSRKGFSWRLGKRSRHFYFKKLDFTNVINILCKMISHSLVQKGVLVLQSKESHPEPKEIKGINLVISNNALHAIKTHIYQKPNLECGGYLIGRIDIAEDGKNVIAYVDDIYHDNTVGSAADYTFTSQYALAAYSYCIKNYSQPTNKKKIIGNYHSHASFDAFFSGTDRIMIFSGIAPEFYLVFSPSHKHITALFKNKGQNLFKVNLIYDESEFVMKEPSIPFETIYNY